MDFLQKRLLKTVYLFCQFKMIQVGFVVVIMIIQLNVYGFNIKRKPTAMKLIKFTQLPANVKAKKTLGQLITNMIVLSLKTFIINWLIITKKLKWCLINKMKMAF